MPYPLSKLAYGLRCRLGRLATPVERYNLQIAAGDLSICPPICQHVDKREKLEFLCENGVVSVIDTSSHVRQLIEIAENRLTMFESTFTLKNCDLKALESNVFDHFLFRPRRLSFENCKITKPFMEAVVKLTRSNIDGADIKYNGNNDPSVISFTDLLTTCPNLVNVFLYGCDLSKTRLAEISQFKNNSLKTIMFFVAANQVEKVNVNDIVTVLKTQKQSFILWITFSGDDNSSDELFVGLKSQLNQLLDENHNCDVKNCTCSGVVFSYKDDKFVWSLPSIKKDLDCST